MAKCVWALQKEEITDLIGGLQEQDARAWLAVIFSSLPHDDIVQVVVTLCSLAVAGGWC